MGSIMKTLSSDEINRNRTVEDNPLILHSYSLRSRCDGSCRVFFDGLSMFDKFEQYRKNATKWPLIVFLEKCEYPSFAEEPPELDTCWQISDVIEADDGDTVVYFDAVDIPKEDVQ